MPSKAIFKTSWRCLQVAFARLLRDVFNTSSRRLQRSFQDVFKTCSSKRSSRHNCKTSWKTKKCYTEDVFSIYVFTKTNVCLVGFWMLRIAIRPIWINCYNITNVRTRLHLIQMKRMSDSHYFLHLIGRIYSSIAQNLKFDWSIQITWKCKDAGKQKYSLV